MKRISIVSLLFLGMAFLSASCGKEKQTWERFYGYTRADLIGHYEANPDNSVYEELPTQGVKIYPNAEIDITEYDDDVVNIRILIPEVWYRNFRGAVALFNDDSDVSISDSDLSDVLMTVYKNADNQVRLHGRARVPKHWAQGVPDDYHIYGFDVVKTENNEN